MLSLQYLLLGALATTSVTATRFIGYTNNSCSSGAVQITNTDRSGACNEIGFTPSVAAQEVDSGCTLYIYTDSVCSANPAVAGLGQCVEDISPGGGFFSYSIKC